MPQPLLDDLIGRLTALPDEQRLEIEQEALKATGAMKWIPSPGPQTEAYFSPADVLLYGGQGGGGKSDLGLGLAFTAHQRSLILRRKYTNLSGLIDRAKEINGTREGFNGSPPPRLTTADKRVIVFGANQHLGDEQDFQGQPFDLKVFDEATQFLELQIRFHIGWLRDAKNPEQRTRAVLATNPPLSAEGDWIIGMFRPWLDVTHPNPAKHGEMRWFIAAPDGKDLEVDGPAPVELDGRKLIPMSRTFIPAALGDNPFLVNTDYQSKLDGLPEPLRSAVRDGNFMASRQDDFLQVIPTDWVRAAMQRWTSAPPDGVPMCAIAVDVAQGGSDSTTLAPRYDGWFAPIIEVPGKDTPTGAEVAAIVFKHRVGNALVIVDMGGGFGGAALEHLKINGIETFPFKGSASSGARTADRQLGFLNKRAEAYWRLREALDPGQPGGSRIMLPDDPILLSDLTATRLKKPEINASHGIQIEDKQDIKKRLGRSPDRGDAVAMAWLEGPKISSHYQQWKKPSRSTQPAQANMGRDNQRRRR